MAEKRTLMLETPRGRLYKRGNVSCYVRWNPGFAPRVNRGLKSAQTRFAMAVEAKLDPYVPFKTGVLKTSSKLASDYENGELVYATPYAKLQYYRRPMGQGIRPGTKRGPFWGQRGVADNKAYFDRFLCRVVKEGVEK